MPVRKRILIVGGVAAGPSAASKAARTNPDVEVTLLNNPTQSLMASARFPTSLQGKSVPRIS